MEIPGQLKSKYRILEEHNFIIEYHEGILTLGNMIGFRKRQLLDDRFSTDYNIFMDMRNVNISGEPGEVNHYARFYIENKNATGNRNIAVLTDTPNQVFFITLFEQYNELLSQKTKVFSTIEASLKWLNIMINESEIKQILNDLQASLTNAD